MQADCPGTFGEDEVCASDDRLKPDFGIAPVYCSLCSCITSMIGCILVILPYVLWKDVRSTLRTIVTFLAVADFFTAFGYTMASFNYITYRRERSINYPEACSTFSSICQIQAYVSSWASLSSFWWTAILALYFYSTITRGNINALSKWFPFCHVFAWGSPMLVMVPLLLTESLGYSLFSAGGWCFISSERKKVGPFHYTEYHMSYQEIVKILAGGKAVEIATYIWVGAVYGAIYVNIRKKKKVAASNDESKGFAYLLQKMEGKLCAIPFLFILVRMWGTLQFVLSIVLFSNGKAVDETGCVSKPVFTVYFILACIQSVGDGAQGWVNAILYIIFSPNIRLRLTRLLLNPVCCCLNSAAGLINTKSVKPSAVSTIQYKVWKTDNSSSGLV